MKKLSKRLSIAILLLSILTSFSWGQDKTDFNVRRNITLKSDSEEQKVPIAITEICTSLDLNIQATIQQGELTIEIYDPEGEKQGNLSIACQLNTPKTKKDKTQSDHLFDSNRNRTSSSSSSSSSTGSSSTSTTAPSSTSTTASSSTSATAPSSTSTTAPSSTSTTMSSSSATTTSSSAAQGKITKSIKNPKTGNWIVKLIPKNASGEVMVDSEQKTPEVSKK
jgi:hypothetical protein